MDYFKASAPLVAILNYNIKSEKLYVLCYYFSLIVQIIMLQTSFNFFYVKRRTYDTIYMCHTYFTKIELYNIYNN